ncbi:7956_t:CDS:2 [Entrophospora sp. SA101]|nr:7956_t:CDS:2 [Entrophospora sp. SA101]
MNDLLKVYVGFSIAKASLCDIEDLIELFDKNNWNLKTLWPIKGGPKFSMTLFKEIYIEWLK